MAIKDERQYIEMTLIGMLAEERKLADRLTIDQALDKTMREGRAFVRYHIKADSQNLLGVSECLDEPLKSN